MKQDRRYLPLFNEDGSWIARPDLYVLVRMGVPEDEEEGTIWQAHQSMSALSNNSLSTLNKVERMLERQIVRGHMTERRYAALVVYEMLRLDVNGVKPSLKKAIKLVTPLLLEEQSARLESSVSEQVRKAFSRFRNTCHLEAAYRSDGPRFQTFENDPKKFDDFLAKAKAFEGFLDRVAAHGNVEWNPWRVPEQTAPIFKGKVTKLTAQEKAVIGVA